MYICSECKSDDIMQQAWVSVNNYMNQIDWINDGDDLFYCNDCKKHMKEIEEVEDIGL